MNGSASQAKIKANNYFSKRISQSLLAILVIQTIVSCTVTTNGETRTYTVTDILNTVDQTLSGNKTSAENSDYQGSQPLLSGKPSELLPPAKRLNWERFLLADMQLHPSFDFTEHVDSYMRIFRGNVSSCLGSV